MNDIMYIREAMRILNHKHYRTFRKWCKNRGIAIFKDIGGKRKYIIRSLFMYARLSNVILSMQDRYNDNWLEMLELNLQGDLLEIIRIEEKLKKDKKSINVIYPTVKDHESKYLSRLNKFISEL